MRSQILRFFTAFDRACVLQCLAMAAEALTGSETDLNGFISFIEEYGAHNLIGQGLGQYYQEGKDG